MLHSPHRSAAAPPIRAAEQRPRLYEAEAALARERMVRMEAEALNAHLEAQLARERGRHAGRAKAKRAPQPSGRLEPPGRLEPRSSASDHGVVVSTCGSAASLSVGGDGGAQQFKPPDDVSAAAADWMSAEMARWLRALRAVHLFLLDDSADAAERCGSELARELCSDADAEAEGTDDAPLLRQLRGEADATRRQARRYLTAVTDRCAALRRRSCVAVTLPTTSAATGSLPRPRHTSPRRARLCGSVSSPGRVHSVAPTAQPPAPLAPTVQGAWNSWRPAAASHSTQPAAALQPPLAVQPPAASLQHPVPLQPPIASGWQPPAASQPPIASAWQPPAASQPPAAPMPAWRAPEGAPVASDVPVAAPSVPTVAAPSAVSSASDPVAAQAHSETARRAGDRLPAPLTSALSPSQQPLSTSQHPLSPERTPTKSHFLRYDPPDGREPWTPPRSPPRVVSDEESSEAVLEASRVALQLSGEVLRTHEQLSHKAAAAARAPTHTGPPRVSLAARPWIKHPASTAAAELAASPHATTTPGSAAPIGLFELTRPGATEAATTESDDDGDCSTDDDFGTDDSGADTE